MTGSPTGARPRPAGQRDRPDDAAVGDELVLDVGEVAHGGHWVARAPDGRVVFVRHALTGERVIAEVTEVRPGYLRADAHTVLDASPDRVTPPCPWAGACGGCDFQHVAPAAQRALKAAVVREQLRRPGGLSAGEIEDLEVRVAELPGGPLGWRTRVRFTVDGAGRAGLLAYRSHEVIPVDRCRIAHPAIAAAGVTTRLWPHDDHVIALAPVADAGGPLPGGHGRAPAAAGGEATVIGSASGLVGGPAVVRERGELPFWQVHPAAPEALVGTVLELAEPRAGESAWDLYGGAGLFTASLAPLVGRVTLVESSRVAVAAARDCLAGLRNVRVVRSTVERFRARERPDLVVLDPPRSGAGPAVARRIAADRPRVVVYVACDPASFARDVAAFRAVGWRLERLRAFDAFPMTHHVELVGRFTPVH